jgi:hypothetical protein
MDTHLFQHPPNVFEMAVDGSDRAHDLRLAIGLAN